MAASDKSRAGQRTLAGTAAGAAAVVAGFAAWLILLPHSAPPVDVRPAGYAAAVQPAAPNAAPAAAQQAAAPPIAPPAEPAAASQAAPAAVDPAWLGSTAAAAGIPDRALLAYASAALSVARTDPACRLGWTTLAAIGAVESGHGTHGGASLAADGTAAPRIVGPRLDGTGFARIQDTDSGTFDGDPAWDRAVGPLQFIPSTWLRYGADGSGDGIADPQNIDDAALAAGRYLCAAGGDLSSGAGWSAAVYAYNHSGEYLQSVLAQANEYAAKSS
ncbi:lytic murein transglycosylase [Arthrobacter sp. I2-34]|uniref:Lytic murein transglycosylase n=1 Tax=Arthrobacter hankyongi TaxID=2904801 RepID=A0ABS9L129_9MICC|nr:lytic murein transglycosylase [Arthrobacter hankyongi]MCG2620349.1 lytic murein transglycosylase [Arthrobacter hankyongi]